MWHWARLQKNIREREQHHHQTPTPLIRGWGRDPFRKVDNIASPSSRRLFIIDPFIENFLPAQSPFVRSLVCSLILLLLIVTLRSDCHPTIKSILSRLLSHPQGKERGGQSLYMA